MIKNSKKMLMIVKYQQILLLGFPKILTGFGEQSHMLNDFVVATQVIRNKKAG